MPEVKIHVVCADDQETVRNLVNEVTRLRDAHEVATALMAEVERLRAELKQRPLPRISDGITDAEAEASAEFDLTVDEVRGLKADRDAAVGAWTAQQEIIEQERRRAEQAEALVERLREDAGWFRRSRDDWQERSFKLAALLAEERRRLRAEETARREEVATQHPVAGAAPKFAADLEQVRLTDPFGAGWIERIVAERQESSEEQPTGDSGTAEAWTPQRVPDALWETFDIAVDVCWGDPKHPNDYGDCCGRAGLAAVLTRLGLREEWGYRFQYNADSNEPNQARFPTEAKARAAAEYDDTIMWRYVTGWRIADVCGAAAAQAAAGKREEFSDA